MLFEPKTKSPITTLDVAIAGKNQLDLQLIFDLIMYTNDNLPDEKDEDGKSTIKVLSRTRRILQFVNSKEAGSLGLHPIIYFYSKKGNFKPVNFYATLLFVKELRMKEQFDKFICVRRRFEEFIYKNDYIFDQINRNLRSSKKAQKLLKIFFNNGEVR